MLTELLCHVLNWDTIWYAHPGGPLWRPYKWGERWFVGVWTGPDDDLVCVRFTDDRLKAERWLSPGGTTILDAAMRSAILWWITRHEAQREAERQKRLYEET